MITPAMCAAPMKLVGPEVTTKGRQDGTFLRGPIPWDAWWVKALPLPGKALAVASVIWWRAGMNDYQPVRINMSRLGIQRSAAMRGLRALEDAGLVQVRRHRGRKPVITLPPDIVARAKR